MRQHIDLVEKGISAEDVGSAEWRKSVLLVAMDRDDASFSMLPPTRTGLTRSVYISQVPEFPVFILDDREGFRTSPTKNSHVVMFGERFGSPEEIKWAEENLGALRAHADQEIATTDFIEGQKRARFENLVEMADYPRGRFGVPLAFFVRPEIGGGKHDLRVKVNANYRPSFDSGNSFSIALRPTVHLVAGHETGDVAKYDVTGMVRWISDLQDEFVRYLKGNMSDDEFEEALTAHPYKY